MCNQGSLVGLCMQVNKSLCVAVMVCATLVNIKTHTHTDRHHFDQLIWIAQLAELKTDGIFACVGTNQQMLQIRQLNYALKRRLFICCIHAFAGLNVFTSKTVLSVQQQSNSARCHQSLTNKVIIHPIFPRRASIFEAMSPENMGCLGPQ